ncbi:MAG: LysM peptidoglycan-binding domain-containing protein [Candidatus Methanoperedens sp.]|nr:LysM peptidoglycan-binding domain-containing protein [Candidatus Methanoperedens sp.]
MKPEPKKGFIRILKGEGADKEGMGIEILYFPPEYSYEKSNSFSEISVPGLESPYLQFTKGNSASISLEVFYDTYESGVDVRKYTNQLTDLMNIDPGLHAPRPLQFIWGTSEEPFDCVLESVTKKFTMFRSKEGGPDKVIPVRARLTIKLKEFKTELNKREQALSSPDKTKIYTVKQGDSLWIIANKEYGTPNLWRPIAEINKIDNPRIMESGKQLIIPPVE